MKFLKAAVAMALMMALTSCKGSESNSPEPAPPTAETISMETACTEIKPLLSQINETMDTAAKNNAEPDDPAILEEFQSIADKIGGIGERIETEEGAALAQEIANSYTQMFEGFSKREPPSDSTVKTISQAVDNFVLACDGPPSEN